MLRVVLELDAEPGIGAVVIPLMPSAPPNRSLRPVEPKITRAISPKPSVTIAR